MTEPRGDDDDELDEFASIRGMFASARGRVFDEEPAPRIDALLMAAARQHAPKPRAAWWARLADWMRPALAHPALAGAAALVIVGGAAGVMYRRGQHHVAAPAPTMARSTGLQREVAPPPDDTMATLPKRPELEEHTPPAEVLQPELPARHVDAHPPVGRRPTVATAPGNVRTPDEATGEGGDGLLIAEGPVGGVLDPSSSNGEKGFELNQADRGDQFGARVGATQGTSPIVTAPKNDTHADVPTAPPPPPIAGRTLDDEETVTTSGADREDRDKSRAQVEQLLAQARTAARAKNCAVVKVMAARVRKLDGAYFRDVFSRDPDVTHCL